MKIVIENWAILILILLVAVITIRSLIVFVNLPSQEQIQKVKECLLLWVVLAEKELGSKTGALKLRYCYELFTEKFPTLAGIVSFETFSSWVDEVLEQAKHLLATNENIKNFVEGENGDNGTN